MTLEEVHKVALESVGRDRSDKDISDWANITWGKLASPRADCSLKRKTKAENWENLLARLDGRTILPLTDRSTPSRRKRSENDSVDETRQTVRRKTDSVGAPLSTRTNVDEARTGLPPLPWGGISDEALIWIAPSFSPCSSILTWKRRVPRELRLHSLDSLLVGGRLGVIVVDECDESAEKWRRVIREKAGMIRQSIVVYGCQTGVVSDLM